MTKNIVSLESSTLVIVVAIEDLEQETLIELINEKEE